jgi:hypothetical protein
MTDFDGMLPTVFPVTKKPYRYAVVFADCTKTEPNGRARRRTFYFTNLKDAEEKKRKLSADLMVGGVSGLTFDSASRADFLGARGQLDQAGWKGMTVTEAVRAWVLSQGGGTASKLRMADLLESFLKSKKSEGAAPLTIRNLSDRIGAWLERARLATVADLTRDAALALRDRAGVSAQTRKNDMNAASNFLAWLVAERHLPSNPLLGVKRPRPERTARRWTVEEALRVLAAAEKFRDGLHAPAVGLLVLAGLRPSEVPQSKLLDDGTVRVEGGKLRGRANRILRLLPAHAAWLRRHGGDLLPFTRHARQVISTAAKVKWWPDAPRHTWISMRLARDGDETKTAHEAGTSPAMVYRHYHRLADAKEAAAFDSLKNGVSTSGHDNSMARKLSHPHRNI